jgi:hypothetical protein
VKTRFPHLVAAVAALLLAGSMDSQACAACFGKSDSAMAQGMNIAKRTAAYEARQALEDASEESLTDND